MTGGGSEMIRSRIDLRPRRGRNVHYDEDQDQDGYVEMKKDDVYDEKELDLGGDGCF